MGDNGGGGGGGGIIEKKNSKCRGILHVPYRQCVL